MKLYTIRKKTRLCRWLEIVIESKFSALIDIYLTE
jgi:hypothetical protein